MLGPVKKVPWVLVLTVAKVIYDRFRSDVKPGDRRELGRIVRKSKGDPRKLTARERSELMRILKDVDLGKLRGDVTESVAPFGTKRLLRRR